MTSVQLDTQGEETSATTSPRVLSYTTLFPNPAQPQHGLFVQHRVVGVAAHCPTRVVAPVLQRPDAWRSRSVAIPAREQRDGLEVFHPPYVTSPGLGRFADGVLIYFQTLPMVRRLREAFAFDVVDAHYGYPDGMAGALLARRFGVPLALTVRGGDLDLLTRYRMRRRLIRWTLAQADRVFAVSRHMAERAAFFGARRERIRIIENGVDLEHFGYVEQAEARRRLGVPADARLLLTAGHLIPEKGQHVLLDALARLASRSSVAVQALIVGNDTSGRAGYGRRLAEQVGRLGLGERVRIEPAKSQQELRDWYCAADLFVLPTFREGMPNVVRESLACGTPVVASRVGGVPELVHSDAQGLLVEPGDAAALAAAIEAALHRDWDRAAIARAGSRRTWADAADRIATELRAMHAEGAGRAT